MSLREAVSIEALQRAIRTRLAIEHGLENPCTVAKLPIKPMEASASGLNWELAPAEDDSACQLALLAAAATVAGNFNLSVRH